jgi:hypothetical protein
MAVTHTRLRGLKAKKVESILSFINSGKLPKIEIKQGPLEVKNFWWLFYVPPDDDRKDFDEIPLVIDLTSIE